MYSIRCIYIPSRKFIQSFLLWLLCWQGFWLWPMLTVWSLTFTNFNRILLITKGIHISSIKFFQDFLLCFSSIQIFQTLISVELERPLTSNISIAFLHSLLQIYPLNIKSIHHAPFFFMFTGQGVTYIYTPTCTHQHHHHHYIDSFFLLQRLQISHEVYPHVNIM